MKRGGYGRLHNGLIIDTSPLYKLLFCGANSSIPCLLKRNNHSANPTRVSPPQRRRRDCQEVAASASAAGAITVSRAVAVAWRGASAGAVKTLAGRTAAVEARAAAKAQGVASITAATAG